MVCYVTHYICTVVWHTPKRWAQPPLSWTRFCIWAQQSIKGEARGAPPPQRLHRPTEYLAKCRCTGHTPREPGWGGGKATPHPRILPPLVCKCKTKSQEREEANARRSQKVKKERRQMQGIPPTHALRNRRHRMLRMLRLGPSHVISWVGPAPLHAIRRRRVAMKGSKQRCRYSLFRSMPLHRPPWSVHAPVRSLLPASKSATSEALTSTTPGTMRQRRRRAAPSPTAIGVE